MQLLDLSSEPAIPVLLGMLRRMSAAENSNEALRAFMSTYSKIRPIDYYVGVMPEHAHPGAFRLLYKVDGERASQGLERPSRDIRPEAIARLPLLRGGVISKLIEGDDPKYAANITIPGSPGIEDLPEDLTYCMALPIYKGDHIAEWTLSFSRRSRDLTPRDVMNAVQVANLIGAGNRALDALDENRRLNRRLRDQLDQIARLQQALLPGRIPAIPGLEIATSYLTSDESGGDYYDFFELPGGRWGILIADVSGHGAAAATVMAMLHAILHSFGAATGNDGADPAQVLRFANDRLCAAGIDGSFITAFYAVYDFVTGEVRFANAGHPPPRWKRGESGPVSALEGGQTFPLGIVPDLEAEHHTVHLAPKDTLILFTDGITEAFNPQREMFGEGRLDAALTKCSGAPDCVMDSVHGALYAHRGMHTRDDDQTLLAIRYHGAAT